MTDEQKKDLKVKNKMFIAFPSWETIVEQSEDEYRGFCFKKWLGENLYVRIERRNESLVFDNQPDLLYVAFCNRAGFPIATEFFPFSESGYRAALTQLLHWAETFEEIFADVKEYSFVEGVREEKKEYASAI
jgi:hypothetical protein